jgi:hypothetical protein
MKFLITKSGGMIAGGDASAEEDWTRKRNDHDREAAAFPLPFGEASFPFRSCSLRCNLPIPALYRRISLVLSCSAADGFLPFRPLTFGRRPSPGLSVGTQARADDGLCMKAISQKPAQK